MLLTLQHLAEVCTRREPGPGDVMEACGLIRAALGAGDAYVVRAGDPDFIRIGCDCPASNYEIKQKGYWLVWRELASAERAVACTFTVRDRLVAGGTQLQAGEAASHIGALLPSDSASSDLLVIRGPWPGGLTGAQVEFVHAARAILAPLVSAVLDAGRRARQRRQLEALANVAGAFNRAADSPEMLTALATALAESSGIAWVTLVMYNDDATAVVDRAVNLARHSDTRAAATFRGPPAVQRPSELVGVELATDGRCLLMPDVFAESLLDRPDLSPIREDLPGLQRYWRRAHILSVAIFPVVFQGAALGHVSFSSANARSWDAQEVEFLGALVAQLATAMQGLRFFAQLEQSRQELRASEERFRSLVQNASDMITVVGEDGTITYQSPSSRHVLGYAPEAVLGQPFSGFLHPDDARHPLEAMTAGAADGQPGLLVSELRMVHRDGSWRQVECIGTDQRANPSIGGFVLNIRDISERKRLERQLRHQAYHDPLTGLVNRREFGERLEEALHQDGAVERLAVLFLDLDNFKEINDSLGHEAGDGVLMEVARRLRECVRPGDVVARLGGDEFAILLQRVDYPGGAERVARRALQRLEQPICMDGREVVVGASMGIAGGRLASASPDRDGLLRAADVAMYAAKAQGKDCFRAFAPAMLSAMVERHDLAAELRAGVSRGEFELHYQPIIDLESGQPAGLEALVRWDHPRHGLLGPGDFITVAEQSGAVLLLGRWVLEHACLQAATWLRTLALPAEWALSVNVSVRQVQQVDFAATLRAAMEAAELSPRRLVLEVTESAMVHDAGVLYERLHQVRSMGVRVALDDFATGYSSLAHLREFRVDLLKIDRRFVADIGLVAPERELVPVILELGRTLGIAVVAEGIERAEQLERLQALGCRFGQGYLLGRPLPAAEAGAVFAPGVDEGVTFPRAA